MSVEEFYFRSEGFYCNGSALSLHFIFLMSVCCCLSPSVSVQSFHQNYFTYRHESVEYVGEGYKKISNLSEKNL